jgi:DNA-binding CsgD family transcriptional regulator
MKKSGLTGRQKKILLLWLNGESQKKIAWRYKITQQAVSNLIKRAKKHARLITKKKKNKITKYTPDIDIHAIGQV